MYGNLPLTEEVTGKLFLALMSNHKLSVEKHYSLLMNRSSVPFLYTLCIILVFTHLDSPKGCTLQTYPVMGLLKLYTTSEIRKKCRKESTR